MHKHVSRRAAATVNAPLTAAKERRKTEPAGPTRFTYALAAYTAERRSDGWYAARTVPSFAGERPKWSGPFETIESACLSIARHLATELADRHMRSVETHKLKPGDPLHGLKPTTRLKAGKPAK